MFSKMNNHKGNGDGKQFTGLSGTFDLLMCHAHASFLTVARLLEIWVPVGCCVCLRDHFHGHSIRACEEEHGDRRNCGDAANQGQVAGAGS